MQLAPGDILGQLAHQTTYLGPSCMSLSQHLWAVLRGPHTRGGVQGHPTPQNCGETPPGAELAAASLPAVCCASPDGSHPTREAGLPPHPRTINLSAPK